MRTRYLYRRCRHRELKRLKSTYINRKNQLPIKATDFLCIFGFSFASSTNKPAIMSLTIEEKEWEEHIMFPINNGLYSSLAGLFNIY